MGMGSLVQNHGHNSYIKGLLAVCEKMAAWPEVQKVIPTRIYPTNTGGELRLRVTCDTHAGVKCIASGENAAQEVFIVTSEPAKIRERVEALFPKPVKKPKQKKKKSQPKELPMAACGVRAHGKCQPCRLCGRCSKHQKVLPKCSVCK